MRQIYVGSIQHTKLYKTINQSVRIPHFLQLVIIALLIVAPIILREKLFSTAHLDLSPVVYIELPDGFCGSAVCIGKNRLLTAAHVVETAADNEWVKVVFYDPNDVNGEPAYTARALVVARGDYDGSNFEQDFALLEVWGDDVENLVRPYILGNSDNVKVKDKVHAIGFPGTSDEFAITPDISLVAYYQSMETVPGEITNVSGGWYEHKAIFVADCKITHGYSGGALENEAGLLIGIVNGGQRDRNNTGYEQNFFLKINQIKDEMSKRGYQL